MEGKPEVRAEEKEAREASEAGRPAVEARELLTRRDRARLVDFGLGEYEAVLRLQEELRERRREGEICDMWLVGEHPFVITQGVRATPADLTPQSAGATIVRIDRGGMTTLHSPGQLILYPIVGVYGGSLAAGKLARALLRTLREWLAEEFGVEAVTPERRPGLYVGERKLLSIGISVRQGVSMHGIAMNVCNDVGLWDAIVACGEPGTRPITLSETLGREVTVGELIPKIEKWLGDAWGYECVERETTAGISRRSDT